MKIYNIFAFVGIIAIIMSCGTPRQKQPDLIQVRKYIDAQNAKWIEAIKQYDLATLLSIYTDNATLMPPNTPMLKGIGQIKTYYERMPSRGVKIIKADLTTLELSGRDSSVYEIGQYFMTVERLNSPIISDTGKYSTIWKLQTDGSWKIYADCWNSNKPLRLIQPPAEAHQ